MTLLRHLEEQPPEEHSGLVSAMTSFSSAKLKRLPSTLLRHLEEKEPEMLLHSYLTN
jgi:hypothetical protein